MRCPECGSPDVREVTTWPGEIVSECESCEYRWREKVEPANAIAEAIRCPRCGTPKVYVIEGDSPRLYAMECANCEHSWEAVASEPPVTEPGYSP